MGYKDEVLGVSAELSGGYGAPAEPISTKSRGDESYEEFLDFDEIDSLLLSEIIDQEIELFAADSDSPCWDGYVQVGMKEKNGKMVPNCVPADEAALYATAGSKPAPKKEQIKGSKKNKEGSAATGKGIKFTDAIISALEKKVETHNKNAKDGRRATLTTLKAVYRRGAGAFSTSHRPDQNRNSWAMARVNAYLHLLKTGKPKNPKYTTDNDLLPKSHPKSTR